MFPSPPQVHVGVVPK